MTALNSVGSRAFANTAIACFAYAVLPLVSLHVLRPDYTPVDHMISDYAVGKYGWVMTTTFVALSVGCLTLALGLFHSGPKSMFARLGTLLLGVGAVALTLLVVVAFIFQFLTLHKGMPYGIANRFFISVLFAWFLTTSIRLRKVARE